MKLDFSKYQLYAYCQEALTSEFLDHLNRSATARGIQDVIQISPFVFNECRQNPADGSDLRAYIKVRSQSGKEIFQTGARWQRATRADFPIYADQVMDSIIDHQRLPLAIRLAE